MILIDSHLTNKHIQSILEAHIIGKTVKIQWRMMCTAGYGNVAAYVHGAKLSNGNSLCIEAVPLAFEYVIGGALIERYELSN